jgi:hypothetical protein
MDLRALSPPRLMPAARLKSHVATGVEISKSYVRSGFILVCVGKGVPKYVRVYAKYISFTWLDMLRLSIKVLAKISDIHTALSQLCA